MFDATFWTVLIAATLTAVALELVSSGAALTVVRHPPLDNRYDALMTSIVPSSVSTIVTITKG
jgi:hypothetical protein